MYPLISEYLESIKSAEDNFKELSYLRPIMGDDGLPVMTSGNFAVVFKMEDKETGKIYALKCFTREQEGREEAYHQIAEELKYVDSSYLVSLRYIDKELFVDTVQTDETEFPVLLMDWVEGKTLDKYLRENLDDKYALEMLAYRFSQLAQWLIPQPFAHGDLKPDNIIVREDGTLVLVDYDGMYVPAMKGQKARELGSPDFRHPLRTDNDFDEHIDDFPLISILLSIKAISTNPQLLEKYGAADRLLLSNNDYQNISKCIFLLDLFPSEDSDFNKICSVFTLLLSDSRLIETQPKLYSCHISLNCLEHYYKLGEKYKMGIDAEQNGVLSVRYYNIAAELGFTRAQYKLGICYRDGFGVEIDFDKALTWFKKAADQGDINAVYNMGDIYEKINNPQKEMISRRLYAVLRAGIVLRLRVNKNKDDINALSVLGLCLIKGRGGEKNEDKGFQYLKQAAEKGNSNAQAYVGYCYYNGKGVNINIQEAVKWFELSANQGNALGQEGLGCYYLATTDTDENKKRGVYWLRRAANQGQSNSQKHLGVCYFRGNGLNQDYDMAFHWFEQSAIRGNSGGENNLAVCYEYGYGTIANRDKARYWYEKAAEKGEQNALKALERFKTEDLPF